MCRNRYLGGKPEELFIRFINHIYKEEVGAVGSRVRSRVLGDLSSEGTVLLPPLTLPPLPLWAWPGVGSSALQQRLEIQKGELKQEKG